MKSFLINITCFIAIPLFLLLLVYIISDPFKVIRPFSLDYASKINREYVSTELFLRNYSIYEYNSFIFGSSRATALNAYHWKSYLSEDAMPFVFQAWSEKLTGIYQKMMILDEMNVKIENVIIMLDIPNSFTYPQQVYDAESIKHYKLSKKSKLIYQWPFFKLIFKPSRFLITIKDLFLNDKDYSLEVDSITNDTFLHKEMGVVKPQQNLQLDKSEFYKKPNIEIFADILINEELDKKMRQIKKIFENHGTKYAIILSPDYSELHINLNDLNTLRNIFGCNNVYNYTGKNELNMDKFNFTDPYHFDSNIGWVIMEEIKISFY